MVKVAANGGKARGKARGKAKKGGCWVLLIAWR
jgi:hypothetical protein